MRGGVLAFTTGKSGGQLGVIGHYGAHAHKYGVYLVAETVDPGAGFVSRDPMGVIGSGGDFAIQRGGGFGDDKRQSGRGGFEKSFI